MFVYYPEVVSQFESGIVGQQRLHGCAAHKLSLSDYWAGPIQIGHYSGVSIVIFS